LRGFSTGFNPAVESFPDLPAYGEGPAQTTDELIGAFHALVLLVERYVLSTPGSQQLHQRAAAGERLMECLADGIGLCTPDGTLVHRNSTLGTWLNLRDGVFEAHGRLKATDSAENSRLRNLIAGCVQPVPAAFPGSACALRITRPSGKPPFVLRVTPIPGETDLPLGTGEAVALVRIIDPAASPRGYQEILRQLFRINPAEIRLLDRLMEGDCVKEAALKLQITENTARSELKTIFA
jgi:DNA-binding CsgD family transcriptional regulator